MANKTTTIKTVYIAINAEGQTLYNKTLGTWNDGQKGRNGSAVWTFSAKKSPEESSTMKNAKAWLERLGHTGIHFELAQVYVNGSKSTPVDWKPEASALPAIPTIKTLAIFDPALLPISYEIEVADEEDELSEMLSNVA